MKNRRKIKDDFEASYIGMLFLNFNNVWYDKSKDKFYHEAKHNPIEIDFDFVFYDLTINQK